MFTTPAKRRGDAVVNLIVVLVFLVAICLAGTYAMGWLHFTTSADKATIEIETGKIKEATQNATENLHQEINDLGHEAGEALEKTGEKLQDKEHSSEVPVNVVPAPEPPVAPSDLPPVDTNQEI